MLKFCSTVLGSTVALHSSLIDHVATQADFLSGVTGVEVVLLCIYSTRCGSIFNIFCMLVYLSPLILFLSQDGHWLFIVIP